MPVTSWSPARLRRRRLVTPHPRLHLLPLESRIVPDVTGTVFRDNNFDGRFLPAQNDQPFYAGVVVTAFNAAGASATGTTLANGTYTINTATLGAGALRVELTIPAGFADGPVGADTNTSVRLLPNASQTGINFGLVNPLDFSQAAPDLVVPRYTVGPTNGTNAAVPALVSFPYTATSDPTTGASVNPPTTLVTYGQIGTTYGLAYQRDANLVFAGAFVRRFTATGAAGAGAIYRVDRANGNALTTLVNLNALTAAQVPAGDPVANFAAGTDTRNVAGYDWQTDPFGTANVHRIGLGDVEISADGRTLYTVNLRTRELIEIPLTAAGQLDATRTLRRTALPIAAIPDAFARTNPTDVRPFAVSVHDGVVYVGATYTAETTTTRTQLRAYVFAYDPNAHAFSAFDARTNQFVAGAAAPVLSADLSYARINGTLAGNDDYDTSSTATPPATITSGAASGTERGRDDSWVAWDNVTNQFRNHQPLLADIEFDRGVLILGLRDRNGDKTSWYTSGLPDTGVGEGDLLRAHPTAAAPGFTLESGGISNGVTNSIGGSGTGTPTLQARGPGGAQFYWGEYRYGIGVDPSNNSVQDYGFAHSFLGMGGLFQVPGGIRLATTIMDPVRYSSGGVSLFDNLTGARPQGYEIYGAGAADLGKANGLGDLEGFVVAAPLEIGNRIWNDTNGNGIQDAGESGIAGVIVVLTDAGGAGIATATTAADGSYLFSGFAGTSSLSQRYGLALNRGTAYRVVIPNATGASQQAALAGLSLTQSLAGGGANAVRDSNAVPGGAGNVDGVIAFTTGGTGANDHTLDAGFFLAPQADVTVAKTTTTPLVDAGQAVAFTVVVSNSGNTTATSVTLNDPLPGQTGVTWVIDQTTGNPSAFVLTGAQGSQVLTLAANTTLATTATLTVRLTGTAGSTAAPFTITLNNTATVGAANDSNPNNNTAQASITVRSPDVTVVKTADATPVTDASPVGFRVVVSNAGLATATGVTLNDPLPPLGGANLWALDPASPNFSSFVLTGAAGSQVLSLAANTSLAPNATLTVHLTGTSSASNPSLPNTATVAATNENAGATANNTSQATITVTVRPPDVTVLKTADASPVVAGAQVGFRVVVSNVGPNPATGVTLNDPLPALGGTNLWVIDPASPNFAAFVLTGAAGSQVLTLAANTTLAAAASLTVHLTGTSTATATPFTQDLPNTATVAAPGDSNPNNNSSSATIRVLSPDVTALKTADAPSVSAGAGVGFTVRVGNAGQGTANGVTLNDPLPALGGSNLWAIDPASPNAAAFVLTGAAGAQVLSLAANTTLAPGASLTVHLTGTSTSTNPNLPNTATVAATNEAPGATGNNASQATITVVSPDVTVAKTADATPVSAGAGVGFRVVVSNSGAGTATGVTLNDPLPALGGANVWAIDPASPNAGAFVLTGAAGSQVLSLVANTTLAAAATLTVHLTGTSTATNTTLPNTATVAAANEPVANTGNNTSTATITVQSPDVTVTKTADATPVTAGGTVGFVVTVINNGPGSAQGVTLSDPLPAGTWTIDPASPNAAAFQIVGQTLSLVGAPSLASAATLRVHLTATSVPSPSPFTQTLTNTATVGAANEPAANNGNNAATATVTVLSPDVTVTKTADAPSVTAGQQVGFTVRASNAGLATATGVTLNDPLPAIGGANVWAIDPASPNAGAFVLTGAAGSQVLSLVANTTLATGAGLTVHLTGTSSSTNPTLPNTATVAATNEAPGATGNNTASAGITIGTLALGDRVFQDNNNDGNGAGEPGIQGVVVVLLDSTGTPLRTATTDANGLYLFTGLPVGSYKVRITPPAGFVSSTGTNASPTGPFEPSTAAFTAATNDTDHGTTDAAGGTITSGMVSLTAAGNPDTGGTANLNVDFGLFPGLSLGDVVWFDTNNNGALDTGETGVAGVQVVLLGAAGTPVATTTTNANGGYLFTLLTAGSYQVSLPASNFAAAGPLAGYVSSTGTVGSATGPSEPATGDPANSQDHGTRQTDGSIRGPLKALTVGGAPAPAPALTAGLTDPAAATSSYRNQDFGVFRPLSLGNLVWEDTNDNGTRDAGEPGLGGLTVTLFSGTTAIGTTTTGADGSYLFTNLVPGAYTVQLAAPAGYLSSNGTPFSPTTGPFEGGLTGNSATDNADHGVAASGNLITGFVVRTNPVTLTGPATPTGAGTNPDGDANLRQDFGIYRGYSLGNVVWLDANNNGRKETGEAGLASVTVRLLDSTGATVSSTTTDANGYYRFDSLPAGSYTAQVDKASAALAGLVSSTGTNGSATGPVEPAPAPTADSTDTGTMTGGFVTSRPVTLGPGANAPTGETDLGPGGQGNVDAQANLTVDFGFFRPLSLGNLVWEDANNDGKKQAAEPGVGGATVALLDAAGATVGVTTTTADGGYLFTTLVPGTYTVRVTPPAGYVTSSGKNASASGPYEPGVGGTQNEEDHGSLTATGLTSTVTLTAPGTNPDGDANLRQDFGIYRPLSVGNQVWLDNNNNGRFDSGEAVLPGVPVRLLDSAGAVVATATTDAAGKYQFTLLSPGSYSVQLTPPAGFLPSTPTNPPLNNTDGLNVGVAGTGGVIQSPSFTLALGAGPNGGNDFPTVDFGLLGLGSLAGRVYVDNNLSGTFDSGDRPLGGVVITLSGPSGPLTTTTDANGRYQFTALPPGQYTVREQQPGGILLDYVDTVGSLGGSQPANDTLTTALTANQAGTEYNFSEVAPARVFGSVFADLNRSGAFDGTDAGIAGVPITISGTAYAGTAQARPLTAADVPGGLTTLTGASGRFEFPTLPPGTYTVSQGNLPAASAAVLADSIDFSGDPAVSAAQVGANVFNNVATPAATARGPLVFSWVPNTGVTTPGVVDPTKREFLSSTTATTGTTSTITAPAPTAGNQTPGFGISTGNPSKPTYVALGSGAGGIPLVRVLDYATGVEKFRFLAYEVGYTGGVRTATGDVTGDGVPDILLATGLGGGPRVRVFDGVTGNVVNDFFAYESTFTGGLFLAVGDVNGDGRGDIITGTEVGGGPRVQAFDSRTGATLLNYFAFDAGQRGGVRIAAADFNKDGRADVVASTGVGVQTRVRVLDSAGGSVLTDYTPYEATYTGGVYVAAGDFNGDGTPDVVVGADAGGGPRVQVFSGLTQTVLAGYFAYDAAERGGVRVAAKDLTGDGKAEIITSTGTRGRSGIKVFRAIDLAVVDGFDFTADDLAAGAYVG